MTFSVPIPIHGRRALILDTIGRWREMDIHVVCIGDRDIDRELVVANYPEVKWINAPNHPLGNKWNLGFKESIRHADHVIFAGSSDWISHDYLQQVRDLEGNEVIGSLGCTFLEFYKDTEPKARLWRGYDNGPRKSETIGIGRVLKSSIIQQMCDRWNGVFDSSLDSSLDFSMWSKIASLQQSGTKVQRAIIPNKSTNLLSISCPQIWSNKHRFSFCTDSNSQPVAVSDLQAYFAQIKSTQNRINKWA